MAEMTSFLSGLTGLTGLPPPGSLNPPSSAVSEHDEFGVNPALNTSQTSLWKRIVTTWVEWRRRVSERRELMSLNDYTLHDIGLTRASAEEEARKPFWKP